MPPIPRLASSETRIAPPFLDGRSAAVSVQARFGRVITLLSLLLIGAVFISLWSGYRMLHFRDLFQDSVMQTVLFRLRMPRVMLAAVVGASLSIVGAALQSMFRNPLAEPFTLGVSGGGTLGASVAIALGWGASLFGVPLVFLTAFAGCSLAVGVVYRLSRTGGVMLPGMILLAGVVMNLIAGAAVLILQYLTDYTRALQILRWTIGSLDVVGYGLVVRLFCFVLPGWIILFYLARDLHLLAMGDDVAASLGVNVQRCERLIYFSASLIVGAAVAVGGTIAFVGLIVPHTVRLLFGEDVRVVLVGSFLLGASFLMLADALARSVLGSGELPVGAVTALAGGVMFLWLLVRQQRYAAF
jgi:ABC-type Fe3+-siderophore transport system permease subunit